ncbi:exocyst complex component EXO70A1-like [Canna indica]|uniref:Exocyst subunit Exo70 family protein n=1 Tax=Canna indica TaxID=4628 RepID=A0AAQ3KIW6_9LILI|nr:exocyst complex component EXO70A1-like [Canna indica]
MTRYTMKYISQLADHGSALADIVSDLPLPTPSPISAFFFNVSQATPPQLSASTTSSLETSLSVTLPSGEEGRRSAVAARVAWPIVALLCKLDRKAEVYGDAALSYLFLANNLQYVVNKVRSSRLLGLLGEDWAARYAAKARQHAAGYEQMAWGLVAATVPALEVSPADAIERFRAFSAALEATCAAQAFWVVADEEMREEVVSMVVPAYRGFYARWREMLESDVAGVRLLPDDVRERLGELFSGSDSSGSNRTKASSRPGPYN